MKTTKKQLELALKLAVIQIIAPDKVECYDFCKTSADNCAVRHSTEEQLKVCIKPITKHFIAEAKKEKA